MLRIRTIHCRFHATEIFHKKQMDAILMHTYEKNDAPFKGTSCGKSTITVRGGLASQLYQ